jgi:hypothetical protein
MSDENKVSFQEPAPETVIPDAAQQQQKLVKEQVNANLSVTSDVEPSRQAEYIEIAKRNNTNPEFVKQNYEQFRPTQAVKKVDTKKLVEEAPQTARWMTNPSNAALAKNDVGRLTELEKRARVFAPKTAKKDEGNFLRDLYHGSRTGGYQLHQSLVAQLGVHGKISPDDAAEDIAILSELMAEQHEKRPKYVQELDKVFEASGEDFNRATREWQAGLKKMESDSILEKLKGLGEATKAGGSQVLNFMDFVGEITVGNPKAAGYISAESLVNSFPALAAGLGLGGLGAMTGPAAPVLAPVGFLAGTFGGSYAVEYGASVMEDLHKRGVDTSDSAAVAKALRDPKLMAELKDRANKKGVGTAATDALLSLIITRYGVKSASLLKASAAQTARRVGTTAVKTGAEMVAEGVAEGVGQAAREGDVGQIDLREVGLEIAAAGPQSAVTAVGGEALQVKAESERVKAVTEIRSEFSADPVTAAKELTERVFTDQATALKLDNAEKAIEQVEEMEGVTLAPEKIEEVTAEMTGGMDGEQMYFQKDDWDAHWNAQGISPVEMADKLLGENAAQYFEAGNTDLPIAIPASEFIAKAGQDQQIRELLEIARTEPDGVTRAEAEKRLEQTGEIMQRLSEEAVAAEETQTQEDKDDLSVAVKQMEDQLRAAQPESSARDAKRQALIFEGGIRALAERMQMPIKEFLQRFPLQVRKGAERTRAVGEQQIFEQATRTPEFRKWFGESVAVNEDGTPLRLFHGTKRDFESFESGQPLRGSRAAPGQEAIFFTDKEEVAGLFAYIAPTEARLKSDELTEEYERRFQEGADESSEEMVALLEEVDELNDIAIRGPGISGRLTDEEARIIPVYLSLENPHIIDFKGGRVDSDALAEIIKNIKANGENDGLILKNIFDSPSFADSAEDIKKNTSNVYVVFEPNQIKSTSNLTPTEDSRILYQDGPQAAASDLGFYSKMEQMVLDKVQGKSASAEQVRALFKDVKEEERKWLGIDDFLKDKKKVSRDELLDFIRANTVQIEEVTLGGEGQVVVVESLPSYEAHIEADMAKNPGISRAGAEERANDSALGNRGGTSFPDLDQQLRDEYREATGDEGRVSRTKFQEHTLPGGENYREVLLTMPVKEVEQKKYSKEELATHIEKFDSATLKYRETYHDPVSKALENGDLTQADVDLMIDMNRYRFNEKPDKGFVAGHFDQPNILAHVRLNDRTDADGNKVLFVEEIQSDWHQAGRKRGYKGDVKDVDVRFEKGLWTAWAGDDLLTTADTEQDVRENLKLPKIQEAIGASLNAVPDAPFRKNWHEFAMKRIIRMASEGGYDSVAWTPGEVQAERYDLSKKIKSASYKTETSTLKVFDMSGSMIMDEVVAPDNLDEHIGKDLAQKLLDQKENHLGQKTLAGDNLKVGGEGMKGFYDKMLVKSTNKLVKKAKVKVGEASISGDMLISRGDVNLARPGPDSSEDVSRSFVLNDPEKFGVEYVDIVEYGPTDTDGSMEYEANISGNAEMLEGSNLDDALTDLGSKIGSLATKVHSLPLTPELKQLATRGFELFQDGGDAPKGRIRFGGPEGFQIELLEKANKYLEVLGDLAEDSSAPQDVMDDYQVLLDWFGVESRDKIGTEQHEQFARGFEAYIMEGKAPSLALRRAFHRFKTWLVNVYKQIRALDVELTEDVRSVMGRLLATQAEISEVQAKYGILSNLPLGQNLKALTDPRTFGMTGKAAERFTEAVEEAKRAAEEQLMAELMAGYKRENERAWKEERNNIKDEILKELDEQPMYKALSILQRGKLPSGEPAPQGMEDLKLDRKSLVDTYGAEFVKNTLPRPFVYSREGGQHHDIVAPYFGYETGDEMIQDLVVAQPVKQFVEQEAQRRMMQKYPDIIHDTAAMEAKAMEAIHNDKQAKLYSLMLDWLWENQKGQAKEAIRRGVRGLPSNKDMKELALDTLGNKVIRDIRPHLFVAAQKRANKEAAKALAAGDFQTAYRQLEIAAVNHELMRGAYKVNDDVKKGRDKFKKLKQSDEKLAKTREVNYINAARAIVAKYMGQSTADNPLDFLAQLRAYNPEGYLQAALQIEQLNDILPKGSFKDLKLDEFKRISDVVEALWDMSREAKTIEKDGKKMDLEEAADEMIAQIEQVDTHKERKKYDEDADDWEKTKHQLLSVRAMYRRMEHWTTAMDQGDPDGPFRKFLWEPISEATDNFQLDYLKYKERLRDMVKLIEPGLTQDPIESEELGFKFRDKAQLVGAMMHMGNEGNLRKLLLGRAWGNENEDGSLNTQAWDQFMERMYAEGVVTKADLDFVQGVWDMYEELKPAAQKTHKKVFGFYFNEVTANAFETPFGMYKGGYAPANIDPTPPKQGPARAYSVADKRQMEELAQGHTSFNWPAAGGTGQYKSRVAQFNMPLSMELSHITKHLDSSLRFIHIKPLVIDASKLVASDRVRARLTDYDAAVVNDLIFPYLSRADKNRVSTLEGQGANFIWKFASSVRNRIAQQIMFLNVKNIVEQVTGFAPALSRVKPKFLAEGMAIYVSGPKSSVEQVADKSKFMKVRYNQQVFDIDLQIKEVFKPKTKLETMKEFGLKHTYIGQSILQHAMDTAVWLGAYNEAIEAGHNEQKAVRVSDSAVRETQVSIRPADISSLESNPFLRVFQMFMSFFNNMANLNMTEFHKIYTSDMSMKEKYSRGMYVYATSFAALAIGSELVARALGEGLDEDDDGFYADDAMEILFGSQVRFATGMVPILGPAVQSGFNRLNSKPWDDRVSASPAVEAIGTLAGAVIVPPYKMATGEELKRRDVKDIFTALGVGLGLPVAPMSKPLIYYMDVQSGRAQPTGPVDYARGLVTGHRGKK